MGIPFLHGGIKVPLSFVNGESQEGGDPWEGVVVHGMRKS